jgi:dienelactone hydrolase
MLISFQCCWDANGLFLIAGSAKELFDACISVHPGPLEFPKDFERVDASAPWYFQCAEWDQWFPDDQQDEAREYLQGKGVSVKLSVYEKTIHGFAVLVSVHGILTLDSGRSFG